MKIRSLRLANDFGCWWPLWGECAPLEDGDPPLPRELATALRAWAAQFNDHYSPDTGTWDDPNLKGRHRAEAHRLRDALEDELGGRYEIELQLWEA